MREKDIEAKLCEAAKKLGGKAIKFTSPYYTGMPDRLVLLPKGLCVFVEMKAPGGRQSKLQRCRAAKLAGLGHAVFVVDDSGSLADFISWLRQRLVEV